MSDIPRMVRMAVYRRDEWSCRRCGRYVEFDTHSIHHRQGRRGRNPHRMSNLVLLCGNGTLGCHGWIEHNPEDAYRTGWKVRWHSLDDTEQVPLYPLAGGVLTVHDDGSWKTWDLSTKETI